MYNEKKIYTVAIKYKLLFIYQKPSLSKNKIDKFGFLISNAKNDSLTVNNKKSVILCVSMTYSMTLFVFYTVWISNS